MPELYVPSFDRQHVQNQDNEKDLQEEILSYEKDAEVLEKRIDEMTEDKGPISPTPKVVNVTQYARAKLKQHLHEVTKGCSNQMTSDYVEVLRETTF